jgi:hypothetical protein
MDPRDTKDQREIMVDLKDTRDPQVQTDLRAPRET